MAQVINTLENFQEATLRTSYDKQPTITHVLPFILGIINYLQQMARTQPHANALVHELFAPIHKIFNGLLQLVGFHSTDSIAGLQFTPELSGQTEGVTFNDFPLFLTQLLRIFGFQVSVIALVMMSKKR